LFSYESQSCPGFAPTCPAASNICPTWTAQNITQRTYKVQQFYDNDPNESSPAPVISPTNTIARSPWIFARHLGAAFTIANCTSTVHSNCSRGVLFHDAVLPYADLPRATATSITWLPLVHHHHCLAASDPTSNATFIFRPCINASGMDSENQLFLLSQYVHYSPGYTAITSTDGVDFRPVFNGSLYRACFLDKKDSRTIEAVKVHVTWHH